MMPRFFKDPDAVLDYEYGWAAWLGDDTIVSHEIVAQSGITVTNSSVNAGVVTVWLSGGELNRQYAVTCRITTAAGRVDDMTVVIVVRQG